MLCGGRCNSTLQESSPSVELVAVMRIRKPPDPKARGAVLHFALIQDDGILGAPEDIVRRSGWPTYASTELCPYRLQSPTSFVRVATA